MEKAIITIRTLLPGETEYFELISQGFVQRYEKTIVLTYKESALTGMDNTDTTIILEVADITIKRQGDFVSTLEFSTNEPKMCLYHTPYGTLNVTTHTREYRFTDHGKELELHLAYGLVIEGEAQGDTKMEIRIRDQDSMQN